MICRTASAVFFLNAWNSIMLSVAALKIYQHCHRHTSDGLTRKIRSSCFSLTPRKRSSGKNFFRIYANPTRPP